MKGQNNYLCISLFLSKKLIIKMMSTHVYFYTIFFLGLNLLKSMAGKRVGVNEVTRGRILVCFKSMCVLRGDTSFCVFSVTVPDWLPCFPVSGLHQDTGYI